MNAHAQTSVAAHYEAEPTAREIQTDLEETKLGAQLLALLSLAQHVDHDAALREADHVINRRRDQFRARPEERLAEQLLNLLGPPEDCFVISSVAERIAR